jgi:ubiquinone/menaquinone biosynthesis C-methylase UbiE
MQRVPEPELMDDPEQALAYARADFSEPHEHFISLFREHCGEPGKATVLDLGCGPGDICRRFARAFPDCHIHAVDASTPMLELGRSDSRAARLHQRIDFIHARLPVAELPAAPYDVIISNSLLHHLGDPQILWQSLVRFGRPSTQIFVMDLLRPESTRRAAELVEKYADGEPEVLQTDFYNSLCAAYTPDEVMAQLRSQGLGTLKVTTASDRHFIVWGRLELPHPVNRR